MADTPPHIARSACKHGITYLDVYSVLDSPLLVAIMEDVVEMAVEAGTVLDAHERPNVEVFAGYDVAGVSLVVFVDRFENIAFHAEPGRRRFGWLFDQ